MSRGLADIGGGIFQLAVIIVIIVAISTILSSVFHTTPTIEVKDCSLASNTVTNNGMTSMTFTIKSNDEDSSHNIRVEFSSHPLVTFMLGSQPLMKQGDVWYYEETLNPSASSSQVINVRASLEDGIAKIDYRITANFYMDGNHFLEKKLDLTVQRP